MEQRRAEAAQAAHALAQEARRRFETARAAFDAARAGMAEAVAAPDAHSLPIAAATLAHAALLVIGAAADAITAMDAAREAAAGTKRTKRP